jgi:hypothetical protein
MWRVMLMRNCSLTSRKFKFMFVCICPSIFAVTQNIYMEKIGNKMTQKRVCHCNFNRHLTAPELLNSHFTSFTLMKKITTGPVIHSCKEIMLICYFVYKKATVFNLRNRNTGQFYSKSVLVWGSHNIFFKTWDISFFPAKKLGHLLKNRTQ